MRSALKGLGRHSRNAPLALAASLAVVAIAVVAVTPEPALAQGTGLRAVDRQDAPRSRTNRPRIRVVPAYPYRYQSTPYPTPYAVEYPGPRAVRQCASQLVQEARPSGTVIVPVTRCWWERG